jgi:hypothetical protein
MVGAGGGQNVTATWEPGAFIYTDIMQTCVLTGSGTRFGPAGPPSSRPTRIWNTDIGVQALTPVCIFHLSGPRVPSNRRRQFR